MEPEDSNKAGQDRQANQKPNKQLLLRAVYPGKGPGMRMDIQKVSMTPQEAIGILELAKSQLIKELSQNQMSVRQDGQPPQ